MSGITLNAIEGAAATTAVPVDGGVGGRTAGSISTGVTTTTDGLEGTGCIDLHTHNRPAPSDAAAKTPSAAAITYWSGDATRSERSTTGGTSAATLGCRIDVYDVRPAAGAGGTSLLTSSSGCPFGTTPLGVPPGGGCG